eukprot:TRINITY_DN2918_c0_g1_i1.p1 TRINITY_DN2918_c0_g1~~TRINITY_DN2918_c0_g1_i1.p1  ORF type:complete len:430 (+),score=59.34 TRINITY_DN2918_c0_g1_i1:622-1911(+)
MSDLPGVLIVGTGEYTTGYVPGGAAADKKAGIIGLVCFDLRRRGLVGRIVFAGTSGTKFPGVRKHFDENINGRYKDMDTSFESFPADDVASDPLAYEKAIATMRNDGRDVAIVFTPDDTHFAICEAALKHGLHVLVTKPAVKKLEEHLKLALLAREKGRLAAIEMHKRFDPIYSDAVERIRRFGDLNHFHSYMSQPRTQLQTFGKWAGTSSDISYYLNSHHIDFLLFALQRHARPVKVTAVAATGIATSEPFSLPAGTEDTITLTVEWNNKSGNKGTSVHTASWAAAPNAEVHSQQRFFCLLAGGEVEVDQAHRGYGVRGTGAEEGYHSINPLFMKYSVDEQGRFAGQGAYGYQSIERFIDTAFSVGKGTRTVEDCQYSSLALVDSFATLAGTAILEAGRISLDNHGLPVEILFDAEQALPAQLNIIRQ